ncbi:MAG: hypothetical protein ABW067_15635 [Rhizobacter sp.]
MSDERKSLEEVCGLGSAGPAEAERYLREAFGLSIEWRGAANLTEMMSHLMAQTADYLLARRMLCKDLHHLRRDAAYVMQSLRTDPLLPYRARSTYDPLGGLSEGDLRARVRALAQTEEALALLVRAYMKDQSAVKGE